MKSLLLCVLFISSATYANNERKKTHPEPHKVENMVKEAKKERKKKVEMCHDCGKPESQCDCEGEEHKKH